MPYYVVYAVDPDPADGPDVATGKGLIAFGDAALAEPDRYPESAHLAQEGWVEWGEGTSGPESADDLEHELEQLTHAPGDAGPVAARLLAALRERPAGCEGLLITDGTEPAGDDE